jgi:hypothetical protein
MLAVKEEEEDRRIVAENAQLNDLEKSLGTPAIQEFHNTPGQTYPL